MDTTSSTLPATGAFDLAAQSRHFGGWPPLPENPGAVVMAFPVEGSDSSAAVVVGQDEDGTLHAQVHGCPEPLVGVARRQALATLSLDVEAAGWPEVGERDPLIGELQARYKFIRPVLFHSPYEAAAAFIIGHRISIKQGRALRAALAAEIGESVTVDGHSFHAFPSPAAILAAPERLPGISALKSERLRAVARAAQDGWLDRGKLRALPVDRALATLEALPGIGPFFSQGILFRGAGTADGVTADDITAFAVTERYGLPAPADHAQVLEIAERWRPYRMWAVVLLHVWVRAEIGLPQRTFARGGRASRAR